MKAPDRVIVGTAGHIDHGKSSLVLALTGTDPDRLPEEKSRGITIELGFAHASWDGITFSFVDVPGHEKFVRTMVAGATGIDVAILTVASDDGVMPQTREHLDILSLLDVRHGLVVRTKADLVDAETGELVEEDIRMAVKGTFLENAPVIPVSAVTGAGLPELKAALAVAARGVAERHPENHVTRLFVDRVFAIKGFGPVVTGTLTGGAIAAEDRLTLWPPGREVRIRRIESHGKERKGASEGARTSLNLTGVELEELERGQCVYSPSAIEPSRFLTAEILVLPSQPRPLTNGMRVRFHHGTAEIGGRLLVPSREGQEAKDVKPGTRAVVQILLESPAAVLRNDRFILRRPSPMETLGGGRVLDTAPRRITKKEPLSQEAVSILAAGSPTEAARLFLESAGVQGISLPSLASRLGLPLRRAEAAVKPLVEEKSVRQLAPGLLAATAPEKDLRIRAQAILAEHRRSGAPSPFMARSAFLQKFGLGLSAATAEAWLAVLIEERTVVPDKDLVGPPGTATAAVKEELTGFAAQIAEAYRVAGFDPPKHVDLAASLRTKPQVVDGLVSHLLRLGVFIRLSPDVVVHREPVEAAAAKLAPLSGREMNVAAFRDLWGLSRKTLIPLLEYFDRQKKTRRAGDNRVVL
ncbi:MAG: selenocysteine-specific translation elongation factor [Thermoanaerobaculia bacterium]|nr:selenocysteine-specific translation elongation factor [Thermoanaerobaculia bacterium]